MPKLFKLYQAFHGGLNNSADPRDIAENEVSDISNMMVDQVGRIRTMGGVVASAYTDTELYGASGMSAGLGFLAFKADFGLPARKSITSVQDMGGYCRFNSTAHGFSVGDFILHYDSAYNAYNGVKCIQFVDTDYYETYDAWGATTATLYAVKLSTALTSPSTTNYLVLNKGATWCVSIMEDNVWHEFKNCRVVTPAGVMFWEGGFLRLSGFTYKFTFGVVQYYPFADTKKKWYYYEQLSARGRLDVPNFGLVGNNLYGNTADATSTTSSLILVNAITDYTTNMDYNIAVGTNAAKARRITGQISTTSLTTEDYGTAWDNETVYIFPPSYSSHYFSGSSAYKTGFNINHVSGGAGTGTWDNSDYYLAQSFIYDEKQETALTEFHGTMVNATANCSQILTVMATESYPDRVTGGRIYYKKQSGGDGLWRLLLDIDFARGVRQDLSSTFTTWSSITATGLATAPSSHAYNYATVTVSDPSALTYEDINGWKQDELSTTQVYNCATILNNRLFVADVYILDDLTGTKDLYYQDRICYSPVGKFDILPYSYFIELGINDGDKFTALSGFGDRILAFKSKKLYVINVSQGSDTGWFLESSHEYMGVEQWGQVFKSDNGVVWVNKNGCFFYDGSEIKNLIANPYRASMVKVGKGGKTDAGEYSIYGQTWAAFVTSDAIVGINPDTKQIIVVGDTNATAGTTYIYDMVTGAWSKGTPFALSSTSDKWSNFSVLDNALLVAKSVNSTDLTTIMKWTDTQTSAAQYVTLRDEDFGDPTIAKRVYGVTVTYKANTQQNMNALLSYAVDGGTSFVTTYIPTTAVATATDWANIKIDFTTPVQCQSIRLKFSHTTGTMEINDVGIEYRPIHKRIT